LISFDNLLYFPDLSVFGARKSLFMIMDAIPSPLVSWLSEMNTSIDHVGAIGAMFLEPFERFGASTKLFHHGLSGAFEDLARRGSESSTAASASQTIRVGYVGNLTRWATDYDQLEDLIRNHPECIFEFFGPKYYQDRPLDCVERGESYLTFLEQADNVVLHGSKSPEFIAEASQRIDIWLACYDARRDVNADEKGISNSHKLMEYLATGKVVVSNLFTMYSEVSELLAMLPSASNDGFAEHFSSVVRELKKWNARDLQQRRVQFALSNTYTNQAERLLSFMEAEVS